MLTSVLYDNDISPISPFSPFFFDTNEQDIHFFQDHHPQHPLLSRDTSSETIAESEVDNNMEVFDNATGDKDGSDESKVQDNKKNSISARNPKKRPFTKDRHSKIVTAQGPRDRRMRLSLDIARRFFMVQDMLGFDKASKTVEWLLVQSKAAISELSAGVAQSKSVSSSSECEVVSGNDEMAADEVNISSGGDPSSSGMSKEKRIRKSRKATLNPIAKESRTKARARARERTIGKKLLTTSQQCPEVRLLSLQIPKSSSNYAKIGEDSLPDSVEAVTDAEPPCSHSLDCRGSIEDIGDESFAITNKPVFDYHHDMEISQGLAFNNNFPNFSGDWDLDSSGTASSYCSVMNMNLISVNLSDQMTLQPQVADIQFYMPWEHYRR